MVDFGSLEKLVKSNTYPHLVSQTDVENVRKIVNANPNLFSKAWNDRGSKRRDSGCIFIRQYVQSPTDGLANVNVDTLYGFFFKAPTGITEWQPYGKDVIHRNPIFNYFMGNRFLAFDPANPTEIVEEHIDFEIFPMFPASIKHLCRLIGDLVGNPNTSELESVFSGIDNLADPESLDAYDLSPTYLIHNRVNNSVEIHLVRNDDNVGTVKDFLANVAGSKRTKMYLTTNNTIDVMDPLYNDENTYVNVSITFDSNGLQKKFGQSVMPKKKKDAPAGTSAQDNFNKFQYYKQCHIDSLSTISESTEHYSWLPEGWGSELSNWENSLQTENLFAAFQVSTQHEGNSMRVAYGFVGPHNGPEPH